MAKEFDQQTTKVSADSLSKILQWLKDHEFDHYKCIICKNDDFRVGNHLCCVPIFDGNDGTIFADTVVPMVQVSCTKCHHNLFFNALAIGIQPDAKESRDA